MEAVQLSENTDTTLLLVRHAEARYNQLLDQDMPTTVVATDACLLTEAGMDQIRGLSRRLHGYKISMVLSSPTTSALSTAAMLCDELSLELNVNVVSELKELDFGRDARSGEGFLLSMKQYLAAWDQGQDICLPGGETLCQAAHRMDLGISRCTPDDVAETEGIPLIVSHQTVLAAYLGKLVSLPLPKCQGTFKLAHCACCIVGYKDGRLQLSRCSIDP